MSKKLILSLALSGLVLTATAQTTIAPAIPRDEKIEQQIETLLKKMTLDEKVGQMCELTIDLLQKRANPFAGLDPKNITVKDLQKIIKRYKLEKEFKLGKEMPSQDVMMKLYMRIQGIENAKGFQLDEAMLDSVIGKYKVGSILNVPNGVAQSVEKWQEIIKRIQEKSMEVMGIPCVYGVDQIHGTTYTLGGTFFPQGVNMGATFNRELTREGARISAYETKAGSIPWTYAPVTDLGRDPRWPRMWENYGEDAYVNAEMGREAVIGFQGENPNLIGENNVAACMKHYMGYGVPVSGKDRTPSSITEQDMREKHFAPYLEMVKAGALSVMVNSAMNNGLPFHANYELLTKWLKEDLNWDGMIVTDWADINNLYSRDHIAKDKKEAIKLAINAGIDMSMDPYDWKFCTLLKELVEEGEVPMSRIDDAVRRVLRLKYRLNLFEKPYYDLKDFPLFGGAEHAAAALQAAEESLVLLKNTDGILPLAKGKKLLVTGPNANSMRCLNGGWSYSWQGDKADEHAGQYNTILEAFTNKFGADNIIYEAGVTYKQGGNWWEENTPEIEKAVAAAAGADYIVACIGENSYCETPGNLTNLFLSQNQLDLVKALAKTGKPIILVLNEGRPRLIADIEPLAKAVVNTMLPGNYGGDALANLIAGDGIKLVKGTDGSWTISTNFENSGSDEVTYKDATNTGDTTNTDSGTTPDTGKAAVIETKLTADDGNTTSLGDNNDNQLGIKGDGENIKTSVSGSDVKVALSKDLSVSSITINNGGPTINEGGIDMNNTKITNIADGDVYEGSKDAVNGGQLWSVQQGMNGRISRLDTKINRVGAGAAALANLHPLDFDPDDKWSFSTGFGNYRNANALAVGAFYRPDEKSMVNISGTFGNGENMVGLGASFKLGKESSVTKGNLQKTITNLQTLVASQDKAMKAQNEKIAKLEAIVAQLMAK